MKTNIKKSTKRSAKKSTKKGFFTTGRRGPRGVKRHQFHILLTPEEHKKLTALSHKKKMNAADVLRSMLMEA